MATKTQTTEEGKIIKAQIWDTAGQERFRAVTNAYYRGALGALIVFDLTSMKTFESVPTWLREVREGSEEDIIIMLIGNKLDLTEERQVPQEIATTYAANNRLAYLETSAKDGENVGVAFEGLINQIYQALKEIGAIQDS